MLPKRLRMLRQKKPSQRKRLPDSLSKFFSEPRSSREIVNLAAVFVRDRNLNLRRVCQAPRRRTISVTTTVRQRGA
jgi:hypothetical protein